ncbi:MAG: Gfo/Idh/MocA family oxidoreductase [Bacteroidales bacterium]|jgi:predicted dehydrogenase|nr:Gfo/Idh/MocA family oxidoreductase [Bacteroidales bacterium]
MKETGLLLAGAGRMGIEYARVLSAMNIPFITVGRGEASAALFREKTGMIALTGGIDRYLSSMNEPPSKAIVAVNVPDLCSTCISLMQHGVTTILLEKPGALSPAETENLLATARERGAMVYIAYNRRFLATVAEGRRLLAADGGVTSFHFEFTEWSDRVEPFDAHPLEKERWFLSNSSHVADLAFFIGGKPSSTAVFHYGSLGWHPSGSAFSGAGTTVEGIPFSYCANWDAPGRWGLELMSRNIRVILRPLEELQLQRRGSVAIEKVAVDDSRDREFKAGLYRMTEEFVTGTARDLCTLGEQAEMIGLYCRIANYR